MIAADCKPTPRRRTQASPQVGSAMVRADQGSDTDEIESRPVTISDMNKPPEGCAPFQSILAITLGFINVQISPPASRYFDECEFHVFN